MKFMFTLFFLFVIGFIFGQTDTDKFNYEINIEPIIIEEFNGLHSFVVGQSGNKYILIGGRKDGIHARQPFAAFPANYNNDSLIVLDIQTKEFWATPIESLEMDLREQLQSSNMNFYQNGDSLILIGGYAYAASAGDHITFPFLTLIDIPGLIQSIINQESIIPYFKQYVDNKFAVCGAQLGKIEEEYYLIGGHRFDGRYNPMGHPTYTQTYTDQIRKFKFNFNEDATIIKNYEVYTDPINLHRRDYNLLPQIFPDSTFGYTLFSGVFQLDADLPFLYPVDIFKENIEAQPTFNQYLSNYHSAKISMYDSENKQMHNVFFGGMSQYYYDNNELVEDQNVPFVSTISRISRYEDGSLQEFEMDNKMPLLQGSGAEFVLLENVPVLHDHIINLNAISGNEIIIGYIIGGIYSAIKNPFVLNNIENTAADYSIYVVKLIKSNSSGIRPINGENPYRITIFPNPVNDMMVKISFYLPKQMSAKYFLSTIEGKIIQVGELEQTVSGKNEFSLSLVPFQNAGILSFTLVLDHKYYVTEKIIIE